MNTAKRKRPNRATVELMLSGRPLDIGHAVPREDVDGNPLCVEMVVDDCNVRPTVLSLESMSWTQAEWDDPTIIE